MDRKRRTLVLDTSAFIAGFDPFAVDDSLYSVSSVRDELSSTSLFRLRFDAAVERGKIKVFEPSSYCLDIVKESSKEVGDINFLSEADVKVIALATQLKKEGNHATIVTDDYSIQNVARRLNIEFVPLATYGIRLYLHWLIYCPACHKKYPSDYKSESCEICGTHIKRRPAKSKPVKQI